MKIALKTVIMRAVAAGLMLMLTLLSVPSFAAEAGRLNMPLAQASDAYELIDAVNTLRIANGLPAYNVHPILMGTAQGQADYMASSGTVTHYGPDGSRPYQRALAAGYPLAGDLSQGGFFSENIIAGNNMSAQEAVQQWLGDAPHTNTMLSTYAQDIGAGVATVGNYVYYVIDVGLSTGSTPRYTPGPGGVYPTAVFYAPLVSTIFPNTPAADGVVRHTVKGGETLWLIAITYGTKVEALRQINGLAPDASIRPGQELIIFPAGTVTPPASMRLQPTMLAKLATATADLGSGTPQISRTPPPPSPTATITPSKEKNNQSSGSLRTNGAGIVILVLGAFLLIGAFIAFRGRRSPPQ